MKSQLVTMVIATTLLLAVIGENDAESSNAWNAHRGRLLFRHDGRSYIASTTKWRDTAILLRKNGDGRICVNVKFFDRDIDRTIAWPRYQFYEEFYVEKSNVPTMLRTTDRFVIRDDVTASLTRQ